MAWRLATSPTRRSPFLVKATTDGVVRLPSALGMTTGSPPSITATQLLVVPRSIPITLPTNSSPYIQIVHSVHIMHIVRSCGNSISLPMQVYERLDVCVASHGE